jgi:hypothetical protein
MRYVILRDDDTNALTPVECLERLYRPFLDRGLPVNLATIPEVRTDTVGFDGLPEGFLFAKNGDAPLTLSIGSNERLVNYLQNNPGYHIAQHGCDHSLNEFDSQRAEEMAERLDRGARLLVEAGFAKPQTFVAPYDKLSHASFDEAARRFRVISTGWFELKRLPLSWWPKYALKKIVRKPHWRVRQTLLLSHPGCLLSYHRPCALMLDEIKKSVERGLTVLVTHWWEYFSRSKPDEPFIRVLHDTADWLANQADLKVIAFDQVAQGAVRPI